MITLIACDRNTSASHTKTINPLTKEEFEKDKEEFEKEMDKLFSKWFIEYETTNSTPEQEAWVEEDYL